MRVYRKRNGDGGLDASDDYGPTAGPRDYDIDYRVRSLRSTYAERLARNAAVVLESLNQPTAAWFTTSRRQAWQWRMEAFGIRPGLALHSQARGPLRQMLH